MYSKFKEIVNCLSVKYSKCVKNVFVLNDEVSCKYLNSLYKTKKFKYLVDPVCNELYSENALTRESLNIRNNATVYLHFGSMSKRKGTLDIVECIDFLNPDNYYIFAGIIGEDIKLEFYERVKLLKENHNILVFDEFCSYEMISSLCKISDFLFMPYKEVYQSSGLIGYASMYNIPVIASDKGMLSKLVKRYKLGFTVDFTNIKKACEIITQYEGVKFNVSKEYVHSHLVSNFAKTLLSKLS